MATDADEREILEDLSAGGAAIGRLAEDEATFEELVKAFRAVDAQAFRAIAERLGLVDRCEVLCHWLRSKECVLLCLELAGPPPKELPDIREFAEVTAKVTADRGLVELLAAAVERRDADAFRKLIESQDLQRFAHLLCHWACTIRWRLVCQVVCSRRKARPLELAGELVKAGAAIRELAGHDRALAALAKAFDAQNCRLVGSTLDRFGLAGRCGFICEWFCTVRCMRVCLRFCLPFPLDMLDVGVAEMRAFAEASGRLAREPRQLALLSDALARDDADAYAALVKELKLGRFCIQLCHWLCAIRCRIFCRCVCRPPFDNPLFTHVGHFHIYGDIDAGSGLTNKSVLGHGGPDYGFFGGLELRGFCPKTSPAVSGAAMRYRFLFEHPAGTTVPLTGSLLSPVIVGSRLLLWDLLGTGPQWTFQTIVIAGAGATPAVTPPPSPLPPAGTPWGGPPAHVIVPDADGWIAVDQTAIDDGFNGALIGFNTPQAFPLGALAPGVPAGTAVPPANQRNGLECALIFEATRVGGPTSPPDFTNTLAKIHVNNWDEVRLLSLLQFHTGGGTPCSPLTTDLDIEYTVDHQRLAAFSVGVATAAPLPPLTLPSGTGPRGGAGVHHENIAAWQSCSYTVSLSTRRALTTGLSDDPTKTSSVTFCK